MDFKYTDQQEAIRRLAREFAEREINPGAAERDRTGKFDYSILKKLGDIGIVGLLYPEALGGTNGDSLSYSLAMEEISRADYTIGYPLCMTLCSMVLYRHSTDEQKQRWQPWFEAGLRGEAVGALAVTEPQSGSNVSNVLTTAVLDGDEWVINGNKCFISHIGDPDCPCPFVMVLTLEPESREFNLILVPRGTAGIHTERYQYIGVRSLWNGEVSFNDVRVPANNLLGARGQGRQSVTNFFKMMSPLRAGGEIGLQQACFDEALNYSRVRTAFNRPISKQQQVQVMLVEMEANLEMSRLLRDKVAAHVDAGTTTLLERSRLKWVTCEAAVKAARYAVEIFGGSGIRDDMPVSRYYRDATCSMAPGGTMQVHKANVARELGC